MSRYVANRTTIEGVTVRFYHQGDDAAADAKRLTESRGRLFEAVESIHGWLLRDTSSRVLFDLDGWLPTQLSPTALGLHKP